MQSTVPCLITIPYLLGDHFGVDKKKSVDHFGVGITSGSIWGSFRGLYRPHRQSTHLWIKQSRFNSDNEIRYERWVQFMFFSIIIVKHRMLVLYFTVRGSFSLYFIPFSLQQNRQFLENAQQNNYFEIKNAQF